MTRATDQFVEEFGLFAQESGDSRISGRILGLLIVEGQELSLSQISERLRVSRASVSTNARLLARRGVIKLTTHAGDRQDYYRLASIASYDVIGEMAARLRRHAKTVETCLGEMRSENPDAAGRAADVQVFFEKSAELLDNWAISLEADGTTRKEGK
jgi:DNA-binding transcriptional regulator GbsR (MarR family)